MVESSDEKLTAISIFKKDGVVEKFKDILGDKSVSFLTTIMSIVSQSKQLAQATPNSVYLAALTSATLDLPVNPNLGFAYIIPYKNYNTGETLAQFQIGYKGFKQLAMRSGLFVSLSETVVKEGELKNFDRLSGEITFDWIKDPKERNKKKTIGYVSYFKLLNGFSNSLYMTKEEMQEHAKKYSKGSSKKSSVWSDDFDSMGLKTVTKLNLSKNAPMSVGVPKGNVNHPVTEGTSIEDAPLSEEVDSEVVPSEKETTIATIVDDMCPGALEEDGFE